MLLQVLLVVVSIAFLVTLAVLLMGRKDTAVVAPKLDDSRLRALEADLEKKRKELDEVKRSHNETKDELKQTKRKLHDQKEAEKEGRDLVKARQDVERSASVQLEVVRGELGAALAEIDRLKNERGGGRRGEPVAAAPAAVPVPAAASSAPAAQPAPEPQRPQRVIRELSPADKEKMDRADHEARRAKQRAAELEAEVRRLRGKVETDKRVYVVTRGELDLVKDKYKALEKRMNRTLLQADMMRRAIADLEKKTGISAERIDLSAEEAAASDRQVEERVTAEQAQDKVRHDEQVKAAEAAARAVTEQAEARAAAEPGAAVEPAAAAEPAAATEPAAEPAASSEKPTDATTT